MLQSKPDNNFPPMEEFIKFVTILSRKSVDDTKNTKIPNKQQYSRLYWQKVVQFPASIR